MTEKQISALFGLGVNIITTILCVPKDFLMVSTFYRSVVINIANIFIVEFPKFKNGCGSRLTRKVQIGFVIVGFVLIGIGLLNLSHPYSVTELPQAMSIWEWLYFYFSLTAVFLSAVNCFETFNEGKFSKPRVADYNPRGDAD